MTLISVSEVKVGELFSPNIRRQVGKSHIFLSLHAPFPLNNKVKDMSGDVLSVSLLAYTFCHDMFLKRVTILK